jgi:hypothetical protein
MACQKPGPSYLRAQAWPTRCQMAACSRGVAFQAERAVQQGQALVDLVASDGQVRGPPRPQHRLGAQRFSLLFPARPGQVQVSRDHRRSVMVRQQRRVLGLTLAVALQPLGEAGMQPRPPGLEQAGVGDLAGQRVLDQPLPLALDR